MRLPLTSLLPFMTFTLWRFTVSTISLPVSPNFQNATTTINWWTLSLTVSPISLSTLTSKMMLHSSRSWKLSPRSLPLSALSKTFHVSLPLIALSLIQLKPSALEAPLPSSSLLRCLVSWPTLEKLRLVTLLLSPEAKASAFFLARCCLGQVPGGAPFSQRSEQATACTNRMQIRN